MQCKASASWQDWMSAERTFQTFVDGCRNGAYGLLLPLAEIYASLLTVFQEPVIEHFSTGTATPVSSTLAAGGNDNDAS